MLTFSLTILLARWTLALLGGAVGEGAVGLILTVLLAILIGLVVGSVVRATWGRLVVRS